MKTVIEVPFSVKSSTERVKNSNNKPYHVSAAVGFKEYEACVEPDKSVFIEYPPQELGTVIELKWWDDYGCAGGGTEIAGNENI